MKTRFRKSCASGNLFEMVESLRWRDKFNVHHRTSLATTSRTSIRNMNIHGKQSTSHAWQTAKHTHTHSFSTQAHTLAQLELNQQKVGPQRVTGKQSLCEHNVVDSWPAVIQKLGNCRRIHWHSSHTEQVWPMCWEIVLACLCASCINGQRVNEALASSRSRLRMSRPNAPTATGISDTPDHLGVGRIYRWAHTHTHTGFCTF